MILRSFKYLLENGEDGMIMEKKSIQRHLMIEVKMMEFLFIGIRMELKLENGLTKMDKSMVLLKFGMRMVRNHKKQHMLKVKKKV